jgi:hypothetical protein
MMKDILQLHDAGKLDSVQASWFKTKPVEELYDVDNDPFELHNLAGDTQYSAKLSELRNAFKEWTTKVGDMGSMPEKEMIARWWNGKNVPPATDTPRITQSSGGVKITCATPGASVGYRIVRQGVQPVDLHTVISFDYGILFNPKLKNGQQMPASPVWQIYRSGVIKVQRGDTLKVDAMRIGYSPAMANYTP